MEYVCYNHVFWVLNGCVFAVGFCCSFEMLSKFMKVVTKLYWYAHLLFPPKLGTALRLEQISVYWYSFLKEIESIEV